MPSGTSWGASTLGTLRTSALAPGYSVAEYCCPVWARSSYTNLIYTQLHSSMHLISGCLQPRQLSWLPVLSNVAPPSLRRKVATDNVLPMFEAHSNRPVYADAFEHPPPRLASRRPIHSTQLRSGERTGRRLLWSTTLLLLTLLYDSQVSISLVMHGL